MTRFTPCLGLGAGCAAGGGRRSWWWPGPAWPWSSVGLQAGGSRHAIPQIVTGGLILAAVTSAPNAVAAIYLARRGRGAATLSTAMNSNALNVTVGLLLSGTILGLGSSSGQSVLVAAWYLGLTMLALGWAYRSHGLLRAQGAVIVLGYVAFAVVRPPPRERRDRSAGSHALVRDGLRREQDLDRPVLLPSGRSRRRAVPDPAGGGWVARSSTPSGSASSWTSGIRSSIQRLTLAWPIRSWICLSNRSISGMGIHRAAVDAADERSSLRGGPCRSPCAGPTADRHPPFRSPA